MIHCPAGSLLREGTAAGSADQVFQQVTINLLPQRHALWGRPALDCVQQFAIERTQPAALTIHHLLEVVLTLLIPSCSRGALQCTCGGRCTIQMQRVGRAAEPPSRQTHAASLNPLTHPPQPSRRPPTQHPTPPMHPPLAASWLISSVYVFTLGSQPAAAMSCSTRLAPSRSPVAL